MKYLGFFLEDDAELENIKKVKSLILNLNAFSSFLVAVFFSIILLTLCYLVLHYNLLCILFFLCLNNLLCLLSLIFSVISKTIYPEVWNYSYSI